MPRSALVSDVLTGYAVACINLLIRYVVNALLNACSGVACKRMEMMCGMS